MDCFIGIDIGSTTVKVVVLDENNAILYKHYGRHYARVRESTIELIDNLKCLLQERRMKVAITGSAGLGLSKDADIEFVQEVFATRIAVESILDKIDVVIELGGEDAKILFLTGGSEERMNGSCAGGTGAFIDQMASLLNVSLEELDLLSFNHKKIYNIASRCGVFAKSDIQPLLNQGANKADVAASIYQAVVDQTIAGLAQGRSIKGRVAFLGGPLTFLKGLQERFSETLKLDSDHAVFPVNAEYFVALGAALYSRNRTDMEYHQLMKKLKHAQSMRNTIQSLPPLFESHEQYKAFYTRHNSDKVKHVDIHSYEGDAYLGIDAGSTTIKLVLITPDGHILYSFYQSNYGEPIPLVKEHLQKIYQLGENRIRIRCGASTGYGEDLIRNAFHLDGSIIETVAHFFAARFYDPQVDFILDIGGQDIKCFRIKNNAVDSIMLNEACSSGCGSFIDTCAQILGYNIADFAKLGLFAKHPVNLGSRCTVFMNSSIKQAQKDGADVADIAAGLAISIIKNALYKVIRVSSPKELGNHIVVQGGTFLNDSILRSFEMETGKMVTRPPIAGLMGAFGAALYAKSLLKASSSILTSMELDTFTHSSRAAQCNQCTNKCKLTVNVFSGNEKYISGNRCERALGKGKQARLPNVYRYKLERLAAYQPKKNASLGKIGIPLGLNMYETLPFWHTLLSEAGFEVVLSGFSTREIYTKGQHTIPSDTVCYPAKLMHGHIELLLEKGVHTIFYPCMTYNFDELSGDNHYNCPVVAYYPELLQANVSALEEVQFLYPYFSLSNPRQFGKRVSSYFNTVFGIPKNITRRAVDKAYKEYYHYMNDIRDYGRRAIQFAEKHGKTIIVLAGRPYHIDQEISHGIDELVNSLGLVAISEDCVSHLEKKHRVNVLNQWTYHSRLYAAARYVTKHKNMQLVQLVSFGCGLDAITTDEVREILEDGQKLYTQIKIDEINNLGAAKIRLRSLIAAISL
ncbi:MAG: acyl-CoA dehydratase activase-related protein [Caldicoprobacterales bacterium]|jgi:predicted CoA-substrate-specific enzyme activase|nr:2-hydroxyglutaryl-CoA dehydratase [Clostridiales bacterium]